MTSPLEGLGTPTPLEKVEKEINQQLRAAKGVKADAPVQRVSMSNLVVYCDGGEAGARMAHAINDVVATHPARVLLLVGDAALPSADVSAAVLVQCRPLGRGQQACTEQVILHAPGQAVSRLPFAVRSLLIGDLPTNVWWAAPTPPPMAGELLFDISETAQQIIYDSVGWTDPPRGVAATGAWLDSVERPVAGRHRVASDLNWRRLKYWRRILSESLAEASAPGAAESITKVEIEHGPHAVVQGYLLSAWLAQRLSWKVKSGKVTGGTETTWRFDTGRGEASVLVRRRPEGETQIARVRISCTLEGDAVTMNMEPLGEGRLAFSMEGTAATLRTLALPPQTPAELVGRQLSDRERDPVFRLGMTTAQQMARSVLS